MIVNLYVDHLMASPPSSAEEVWNATKEHPRAFKEAARKIGLTPAEYQEFRNDLLDGKAVYVRLPAHMDAMAGDRNGSIYAVKNAYMPHPVMGWKVSLSTGAVVYVPQTCGNLAMSRFAVKPAKHVPVVYHHYTPPAPTPAPVVVNVEPTPVAYVPPPAPPPVAAAAVTPPNYGWLWGIPVLGGLIYVVTQPHSTPPPCSQGSNEYNVCSK
jgi:hypothetical protein